MSTISDRVGLLLIDVQQGFDDPAWETRNNPEAEQNIARLLRAWRAAGWSVLHAQHLSTSPTSLLRSGQPGCALQADVTPEAGEPLFQKRVDSAFIGTDLEAHLRERGIGALDLEAGANRCVIA